MACRSNECPSATTTGLLIRCSVMGQRRWVGVTALSRAACIAANSCLDAMSAAVTASSCARSPPGVDADGGVENRVVSHALLIFAPNALLARSNAAALSSRTGVAAVGRRRTRLSLSKAAALSARTGVQAVG